MLIPQNSTFESNNNQNPMNNNGNTNVFNNANTNFNNNANQNMNNDPNPNMNNRANPNMNNMNNNMGFMPQMSPQQYQMMMNMQKQQFELQKQQARQIGQLLKRQKEFVEGIKRREEERKKEDREIILFFNHDYDILPLTFRQSTTVIEALTEYLNKSNKQNVIFKFEGKELKLDFSGQSLRDIEGLINGSEITVITKNQ